MRELESCGEKSNDLRALDVFFSFLFLHRLIKGCGALPLIMSETKLEVGYDITSWLAQNMAFTMITAFSEKPHAHETAPLADALSTS